MSNLIKSRYINVNDNRKIIDSDNSFQKLSGSAARVAVDEYAKVENTNDNDKEFVDGINVLSMQRLVQEEEQLIANKANNMLEEAKKQAELIIEEAKEEAKRIKDFATEEGKRIGYTEGMERGQEEIRLIEDQLHLKMESNQERLKEEIAALEPKFANVVSELLTHLTGVVVSDNKEVIFHLIQQAIAGESKCKAFTVKLSTEDYELVRSKKDFLVDKLPDEVEIHLVEESIFQKNQCMIEDEKGRIIDCSLDVQLKNLITNIKMLASI